MVGEMSVQPRDLKTAAMRDSMSVCLLAWLRVSRLGVLMVWSMVTN